MDLIFIKSDDQNSRQTGQPLKKRVRYEEQETSFFKEQYLHQDFLNAAYGGVPEQVTVTFS